MVLARSNLRVTICLVLLVSVECRVAKNINENYIRSELAKLKQESDTTDNLRLKIEISDKDIVLPNESDFNEFETEELAIITNDLLDLLEDNDRSGFEITRDDSNINRVNRSIGITVGLCPSGLTRYGPLCMTLKSPT